ncbi:angiopoietin-1-like [Anopheles stephensi]|uniref:angiopoietin-1-like n=1 Tax=Anopheles stephensi TaxID=30069 RepID=UPI001658A494|nr:angiopoietin-1-like [Anopheles stephensi]
MKLVVCVLVVGCLANLCLAKIDAVAPKYGVRPIVPSPHPPSNGGSDIDKCGCHEIVGKLKKVESNLLRLIQNLRNKYGSVYSKLLDMKKHAKSVSWYVGLTSETSENINEQLFISSITTAQIMQWVRELTTKQQKLLTKTFLTESILALENRQEGGKPPVPEGDTVYTSCDDERITQTGTYLVQDVFAEPTKVVCVLDFQPGAYTVIQNRQAGSTDFYRGYSEYRSGFGEFDGGDYWLGLDRIHNITSSGEYELFILLEDFEKNVTYARYDNFEIGSGNDFYPITKLDGYSGPAGDSYGDVVGVLFSAYDLDLDNSESNCAVSNRGAWWYTDCGQSNLNGLYLKGLSGSTTGMFWETFRGPFYSLKKSRMMVKRKQMPTTTESTTTTVSETTTTTPAMGTETTQEVTEPAKTTFTSTTIFTTTSGSDASSTSTMGAQTAPSTEPTSTSTDASQTTTTEAPTITTTDPETSTMTTTDPETSTMTTTDPETSTITTMDPETSTMTTMDPETSTMTTTDPETSTMTTMDPETPAITTVDPETTTAENPTTTTTPGSVTAEVTETTVDSTTQPVETMTMPTE